MSAAHSAVAVLSSRLEPYLNRFSFFFFFNDTATTEIYTLSLHDALPIYRQQTSDGHGGDEAEPEAPPRPGQDRSEEHTSELQSQSNLVCRLLLEKKKKPIHRSLIHRQVEHQRHPRMSRLVARSERRGPTR